MDAWHDVANVINTCSSMFKQSICFPRHSQSHSGSSSFPSGNSCASSHGVLQQLANGEERCVARRDPEGQGGRLWFQVWAKTIYRSGLCAYLVHPGLLFLKHSITISSRSTGEKLVST